MSEGDVSLIRDEDVLRRMWQQTEDFSRKKEIRAHMYRLREERLRSLYSPEPGAEGKGCEFSSTQGHVKSFADQSFQSMKSKEVRDAGSPPKEFTYRGQDLKELSNAGWNVESENRTTDDGHTRVKSVQANIEGKYDVEGGRGQFAAFDQHKQAVTEYDDGNTSLKRNESSANTAAHEQVVRKTDDGTQMSSTTSSSSSTSKLQKYSSTNDAVPYLTSNDYDTSRQKLEDTNRNEEVIVRKTTQASEYEQNLRSDYEHGEVVSRKVEYPDNNTKVVVETRRLPDGTKITSTRREFHAPVVQSSRSEQHSQQTKTENKSSYTSKQQRSHINESSSKTYRDTVDNNTHNIVDTQRVMDDFDFNKNRHTDKTENRNEQYMQSTQFHTTNNQKHENNNNLRNQEVISSYEDKNIDRKIKETHINKDNEERIHKVIRDNKQEEIIERKISSDQYQTTYQADFTQKKISNDWSPSQQAWASSLRSDTPTRPSTRASSPGSKTFKSSNSSLRSSVSPDKTYKKPPSRGGSPNKVDRYSPTRTFSDRYSNNHSNHSVTEKTNSYTSQEIRQTQTRSPIRPSTSPDRKSRPSISPEKRMHSPSDESRIGFDREPHSYTGNQSREGSPTKTRNYPSDRSTPTRSSPSRPRSDRSSPEKMSPSVSNKTASPTRLSKSPDRKAGFTTENILFDTELPRDSSPSNKMSPKDITTPVDKHYPIGTDDKTPGYMRSTASSKPKSSDIPTSPFKGNKPDDKLPGKTKTDKSPERKPHESAVTKVQKEHYKFIDEETKMYTRTDEQQSEITSEISSTHKVFKRPTDGSINIKPDSKTPPTLVKQSPSPDSPDDNEHATGLDFHDLDSSIVDSPKRNISPSPDKYQSRKGETPTRTSPSKDVPSYEKPLIDEGITKKGDKSSPPRDSSHTKNRPGSRTTSPRSSLRNKSLSPEKHSIHVTSFKQTSEKVTATSNVSESTKISSRKSSQSPDKFPLKERSPTKKSPTENLPSSPIDKRPVKFNSPPKETSPIRKTPVQDTMKHFVKESSKNVQEIKEYSDTTRREPVKMTTKSSPARKSPTKDMPDFARTENVNKSLPSSRNTSRSPSPIKGQIRDTRYDTYIKTEKSDQRTTENSKESMKNEHRHTTVSSSFKDSPSRETSPSKNGNYSKQQQDKGKGTQAHPKSPARQPASSMPSTKIQTLDLKKQVTTEFIDVERTVEEINKNTVTKERPKQLVTPSTSPTRKPKGVETEPSTGQSSPTTSVSGFVYFSSPSPNKDIITDLDDDNLDINMDGIDIKKKPDEDVKSIRSKSPSKIPCRSPSPEKRPVKDNLPRKSSLKKPSVDNSQVSPTEKPPSSFSVSPMVESKEFQPDNKEESTPKSPKPSTPKAKPPLERRETYEERCRKILGMSEDTNNESTTVTSEDKLICQHSESNSSSPSVSPCRSPTPEESTCKDSHKYVKTTITDFLEKERVSDSNPDQVSKEDKTPHELLSETTPMKRENEPIENKPKFSQTSSSPSNHVDRNHKNIETNLKSHEKSTRDSSPTKLKDIISNTKHNIEVNSEESRVTEVFQSDKESFKQTITNKINKDVSRQSPERKPNDLTTSKRPYSTFNQTEENNTNTMKPYDNYPTVIQPDNIKPLTEYDMTTNIIETVKSNTEKQKVPANSNKISKQNLSGNTPVTSSTVNKKEPVGKHLKETSPMRSLRNSSLEKRNNTPKTNTAITSTEHNLTQTTENIHNITQVMEDEFTTPRSSPTRTTPDISATRKEETRDTNFGNLKTDYNSDLISSEREQEVLDRVNKSLRKLSPDRKNRSPNREKSPEKQSTTSTNTIKVISQAKTVSVQKIETDKDVEITKNNVINKSDINKSDKQKDSRVSSKPPSRNVSPVKKNNNTSSKPESPDSASKTRSISPKKPTTPIDRPQSPQIQKNNNPKSRDSIPSHIRRPSPSPTSPTRTDKLMEKVSIDSRKTISAIKHNSFTRIANKVTPKASSNTVFKTTEQDSKQQMTPKGINKENIHPKKDSDIKVMRTSSDIALKTKKISSQRMKSKPEIQVSDMSTTKQVKQSASTMKGQKSQPKESPINFPTSKPKSATALNTSTEDDDDIIIDVQQAKSSRENSPDRICPTPVGFLEDVGTPRFPDEVNEPDDDFNKRNYHTIHESESIVDDIVEICEDDELFVRQTNFDETDKYLLKVNEKLPKYSNKSDSPNRTKETITRFKDVESKVHSDFNVDNIKSDECLLSVSEKVTKFAKGPRETKDKSPSRNIVDEYDKNTIYQDDYTKLSVNDKAHLFVETAENVKLSKPKPVQKIERPDFSDIDDSLKSDDCLLSVSDKVNKFVKTAEQFLSETHEVEEKDKKIKEEHDRIMKKIVNCPDEQTNVTKCQMDSINTDKYSKHSDEHSKKEPKVKEISTTQIKNKDNVNHNLKPTDRNAPVKITTLRSSEAVKKAKALFENIASTTQKTKDVTHTKTTKLTDIGVIKKTSKFDIGPNVRPSLEDDIVTSSIPETEKSHALPEKVSKDPPSKTTVNQRRDSNETVGSSPEHLTAHSSDISRTKSPLRQVTETATTTTKTILSRYPTTERAESPKHMRSEPEKPDKPHEKVPGYLRATKTSQKREEKTAEVTDSEVSSRRGSGKFGVELRRTSVERSTVSSERRRSVEHHQPCIEDIFDLDLLEQMLEKVVGYEQRRRIRAQIRIAKKRFETEQVDTISTTHTRTSKLTTKVAKAKSPDRPAQRSPDRHAKPPHKTFSPDRQSKSTPQKISSADHHSKAQRLSPDRMEPKEPKPILNGHGKETSKTSPEKRQRPHSPEKPSLRSTPKSPVRQPSPEKKSRPLSPMKTATPKSKANRFNEYATAYMKKVGLESDKLKVSDAKIKKITEDKNRRIAEHRTVESRQSSTVTKSVSERTTSKDTIEIVQLNGKRSPSPETKRSPERKPQSSESKAHSPERKPQSPDRKAQSPERKASPERVLQSPHPKARSPERKTQSPERTATPETRRVKDSVSKKEVIVTTVDDVEKKLPQKQRQDEKPSWVTNRNLKKITSETRTFSTKKMESEKPKYRAPSPSKVISRPLDVITSSYGPGPLDADGRPLFGIKALRNGATNFQVKGTVVRQEFHSRNGGAPEGTVSVTAYSTEPEELERLLRSQGERPSRLHGLAAITTTRKFGGDTGTTLSEAHNREERAALDQFTHSERRTSGGADCRAAHAQVQRERVEILDVSDLERRHSQADRSDRRQETTEDRSETDRRQETTRRVERTDDRKQESRREEERRKEKMEKSEKSERIERREDRKTVRQSSVKSLTEKFIKSASESKTERSAYPKAGLILRSTALKDSVSSDSSAHQGLTRTDSEHSLGSVEDAVVTTSSEQSGRTTVTTTRHHQPAGKQERSFLDSTTKVTGVQDILTRMKNADIVIEQGDSSADAEARALLNKFLGASVLMAGMQGYVCERPEGRVVIADQESVKTGGRRAQPADIDQCWDERVLRRLLDECSDYEQRRRLRARIRTLMAEQEACASAVTEALAGAGEGEAEGENEAGDAREEAEVTTTVTSSVRRNSSEKTVSSTTTTTTIKNSKVIESMLQPAPKPVSPFAKFRQLEKQNSTTNPSSPKTPQSPGSPSQPYFKFTDPALQASAVTIKERLLQWCRDKTRDYENVKLENFSTSWADGLAFCALLHHFLPAAFDYGALDAANRRHNFTLAFRIADEKAGIYPLLDVDDMVAMRKPDWKCVFTYVQSIYRRFKDQP